MTEKTKYRGESLFFQKQKDYKDGCRIYAINNLIERKALSEKTFNKYCLEFDRIYKCKGTQKFFFLASDNNIISFILSKFKVSTTYYPPNSIKSIEYLLETTTRFIVFSSQHIWCCRKHNNVWYSFDSIQNSPSKLRPKELNIKFGYIVVN